MIKIIDDGNGFKNEIFDKIGQPYIAKNVNGNANGMGLGIFIAKNLIENMGGKLIFSNNKNEGASIVEIII